MRIAQVNDIAGVATSLAAGMQALGEEATVIQPWQAGASIAYPWKLLTLPTTRAAGVGRSAIEIRRGGFDAVHVHYGSQAVIGVLAGQPFALHFHGSDVRGLTPHSRVGRVLLPFIRRARLAYYATPDLEQWVLPFRRDAIFLPNPIDTERFRPSQGDRVVSPDAIDGNDAATKVDLLVGVRLSRIKGLDTIVEVLRCLAVRRPSTTITIVAQGEGVRDAIVAARGERTEGGSDAGRVTVVPPVPQPNLPAFYRRHRVALGQFLVGAMGNYELECIASGLPVAMRFTYPDAYPQAPPILSHDSAEDAAAAIVDLLDHQDALDRVARDGRRWVDDHHGARMIASRVLADYAATGVVRAR